MEMWTGGGAALHLCHKISISRKRREPPLHVLHIEDLKNECPKITFILILCLKLILLDFPLDVSSWDSQYYKTAIRDNSRESARLSQDSTLGTEYDL